MFEEMSKCKELYTKYGGHPMAAGLSLPKENVEKFRTFLNEHTTLTEEDFIPKITIDVPMPIGYVTEHLIEELSVLEPFGKGNEKPLFAEKNLKYFKYADFRKEQKHAENAGAKSAWHRHGCPVFW